MEFVLVDEILEVKKGESITAVKDAAALQDFFVNHAVYGPIVPSTLVAEAVAQAAGWLISASLDFKKRGLLIDLGRLEFTGVVRPRDKLTLEAELLSLRDDAAMLTGRAGVEGKIVGRVDAALCVLVAADKLDDIARTRAMFSDLVKGKPRVLEEVPRE